MSSSDNRKYMLIFCELYYFEDSFVLVYLWVQPCWVFYIEFTFCAALALETEWQGQAPSHLLAHILTHDISPEPLKRAQSPSGSKEGYRMAASMYWLKWEWLEAGLLTSSFPVCSPDSLWSLRSRSFQRLEALRPWHPACWITCYQLPGGILGNTSHATCQNHIGKKIFF